MADNSTDGSPDVIRVAIDAHVVGRRKTGNETYVTNLASALAHRSDVHAVAYVDNGVRWPSGLTSPQIRHLRLRAPQLRIPVELPYRARADGAQVLHVQYVAPFTRTPVVNAVHDLSFEDLDDAFSRRTRWRLQSTVRWSARHAAAVVTLSRFTRSRLLELYGLEPSRVFVAPGGVAKSWQRLAPELVHERLASAGVPPRFVLAVGNLHPRKNIPRLIRAVHRLRQAGHDDLALVLAGQRGWRGDDVDASIARVRGDAWVRELGFVPDTVLEALYNAASVVAYPSLYEGFGLPVAEALAVGCVVVASNTTSIPEVAGDAAILVDPLSDDDLAAGLDRALTDSALRTALAIAGPRQAAQFTWDSCADATVEAYRTAIQ
jgi:glycosyltransferase involved in cell wall biosynthesis